MDAQCNEFKQHVIALASAKKSHYYYTAELPTTVTHASKLRRTITVQITITPSEITSSGCIDEGLISTVADYWTSTLISAVHEDRPAVTTSLTVQAPKVIAPGTKVDVVCLASEGLEMPYASARFVDAADANRVYAVASHTKFFKNISK